LSVDSDEVSSFDSRRIIEAEERYGNASVTSSRSDKLSLSTLKINESTASRSSSTEIFPNASSDQSSCQRSSLFHSEPSAEQLLENKTNDSYKYLYIQMELCREENLAKWLKTHQPVELKVHQMFREILSAVNYLHSLVIIISIM
jgi:hypothetical protein